jgi:hypothetical protein
MCIQIPLLAKMYTNEKCRIGRNISNHDYCFGHCPSSSISLNTTLCTLDLFPSSGVRHQYTWDPVLKNISWSGNYTNSFSLSRWQYRLHRPQFRGHRAPCRLHTTACNLCPACAPCPRMTSTIPVPSWFKAVSKFRTNNVICCCYNNMNSKLAQFKPLVVKQFLINYIWAYCLKWYMFLRNFKQLKSGYISSRYGKWRMIREYGTHPLLVNWGGRI